MATINLGAIKFNWKGAYNSSTSYAVDDVVSSGGNSYVCIQAHSTAQAVGNATAYWNIMSSAGTNGTNGTDVGTTLTTQSDLLYRDGSGLQRLPKGTANQLLRINSGATAPEWHTPAVASSDFVKIATVDDDNVGANGYNFSHCFSEGTYQSYQLRMNWTNSTAQTLRLTFLNSSNVEQYGSETYKRTGGQGYRQYTDNGDNTFTGWNDAQGGTYAEVTGWNSNTGSTAVQSVIIDFDMPKPSTSNHKAFQIRSTGYSTGNYMYHTFAGHLYIGTGSITGFRLKNSGGNITKLYATLYGMKV